MSDAARVALLTSAFVAAAVGLALDGAAGQDLSTGTALSLGQALLTAAGVLTFGAGLLRLATSRLGHQAGEARRAGALSIGGLVLAALSHLNPAAVTTFPIAAHGALVLMLLAAAAAAVTLVAALRAFVCAADDEEARIRSVETALRAATATSESRDQQQRDLRHEARNALFALRMATQTLADVGDRLDEQTRQRLRGSVLAEVGHLDQLISRATKQERVVVGA